MFLTIKNIGKIQNSTIEMKGITVIAGVNNTGKSTFGKVLFCMFNAFHDTDEKVHNSRVNDVRRIFRDGLPRFRHYFIDKKVADNILSKDNDLRETIVEITKSYLSANPPDDNIIDALLENLRQSIAVDKYEILKMIVTRYFEQEFSGKINHLNRPNTPGDISLEIKKKKIEVTIKSNECTFLSDDVGLFSNAIYIDTPFVMEDAINIYNNEGVSEFYNLFSMTMHRDDLLYRLTKNKSNTTILEEVIFKQKINNLLYAINSVVEGEFKEDKKNLLFSEHGLKKPVPLLNVSAGIKMFLIIKRLLELGEIKERGVLILDEPEIHLHPDWQLRFAEILVLLQKEFNLTILLTTHSPYFLHAIETYTYKYELKDKANYYLAESEGDTSGVQDVTQTIDTIYQQLAKPFQKLEDDYYEN